MTDTIIREGGCACGAVRFEASGEAIRAGLCHCMDRRKAHASAFMGFAVYRRDKVEIRGENGSWASKPWYQRHFCPACGSRVSGVDTRSDEIELPIGAFDEVGAFAPQYENWVIRREPWLAALGVPQNSRDGRSNSAGDHQRTAAAGLERKRRD
jgi:hypothetical protein